MCEEPGPGHEVQSPLPGRGGPEPAGALELALRVYPAVVRALASWGHCAADREDLAHDTIVRLLTRIRLLEHSRDPDAYAAEVARNVARSAARASRRWPFRLQRWANLDSLAGQQTEVDDAPRSREAHDEPPPQPEGGTARVPVERVVLRTREISVYEQWCVYHQVKPVARALDLHVQQVKRALARCALVKRLECLTSGQLPAPTAPITSPVRTRVPAPPASRTGSRAPAIR
jgi:DNA-directed RNA polymerase specialized sigma24 family protein